MEITRSIRLHQDHASCKQESIHHEQEGVGDIRDTQDGCRCEHGVQGVEGFLLGICPRPGVVLSSEEDNGCNNIGVVGNEFAIEVCKFKEGVYSLYRGWECQSLMVKSFSGSM